MIRDFGSLDHLEIAHRVVPVDQHVVGETARFLVMGAPGAAKAAFQNQFHQPGLSQNTQRFAAGLDIKVAADHDLVAGLRNSPGNLEQTAGLRG